MKVCAVCGEDYEGKGPKYCSPPCAYRGHQLRAAETRRRAEKQCQTCGAGLTGRRSKFCSDDCQRAGARAKTLAEREDLRGIEHCGNCNKELIGRQQRWCSLACARAFNTTETHVNNVLTFVRTCRECGIPKPLAQDFYKLPNGTHRRVCKACVVAGNRARDEKPDVAYRKRDSALRSMYNLSALEYEQLLQAQAGVCAVCGKPPIHKRLAVDHDHVSGLIRGLLCNHCNLRLVGKYRESRLLHAAADYLDDPPARRALGRDVTAPGRPKKKRKPRTTRRKKAA